MSESPTFEKLQELKDLKKKCEENLKGESVIAEAENSLKGLEENILKLLQNLKTLQAEKERLSAITSGRAGLENSKLIIKELEKRIPELESVLKAQTN